MEKTTYYAQEEGWILDQLRQKGEMVEATAEEAKYALQAGTLGTEKPVIGDDAAEDGEESAEG